MATHDRYDNDILKQLTRIANSLEKIEKKIPDPNAKNDNCIMNIFTALEELNEHKISFELFSNGYVMLRGLHHNISFEIYDDDSRELIIEKSMEAIRKVREYD